MTVTRVTWARVRESSRSAPSFVAGKLFSYVRPHMDREEATEALALLRKVIGQAKDDTTLQNWGWLWVIHGATNCGAFLVTNELLRRGHLTPGPYVAL